MSAATLMQSVTLEQLTDLLQAAGYRVTRSEQNGIVQLLSASQGIGYAVRAGNADQGQAAFVDFTFSSAVRIQGELPPALVGHWNASRRFARLSVQGGFLLMEMDVVIAAGVSQHYVRNQLELWDRLLQEFLVYLRDYRQPPAEAASQPVLETSEA